MGTGTTLLETRRIVAARMADAAGAFLHVLGPDQRARAALPFDDGRRTRWYYTPTARGGLPLREMDSLQQARALALVATGLSTGAYNTACTIMGLENILGRAEGWRQGYNGYAEPVRNRDPLLYFVAVYGDPAGSGPWGWHAGGHHVSLNYTVNGGLLVSPTPTFFGANPAESPGIGAARFRPLGAEEDLGRALLDALDPPRRARAVLAPAPPLDIVQGNRPRVTDGATPMSLAELFSTPPAAADRERIRQLEEGWTKQLGLAPEHVEAVRYTATPRGLPARAMTASQRDALRALVRQYVLRLPDDVAEFEWAEFERWGLDEMAFAWAGAGERGRPHYYRVQGPRMLIEYDNVQDDTNHIHAVWRDPEGDFGGDPLRAHRAAAH